jgi:type I restriction enzyme S subunit
MIEPPPGWAEATLGDLVVTVRGLTYKKEQASTAAADGLVPLLRATNVQDGRLVLDGELLFLPEDLVRDEQWLRPGDIVIASSSGSSSVVGKSAPVCEEWHGTFGAFCTVLRPSEQVEPRFLAHLVGSPPVRRRWSELASGTNINNLKSTHVTETPVALPPLTEQRRIVAAIEEHLSHLDAAASSLADAYRRVIAVRNSVLHQAIDGLPERPLGDFAQIFVGTTPSRRRPDLWHGDVPWVSSGEVAFRRISQTRETIASHAIGSADRLHPPGTVLLGMIGEGKTRGQAAILDVAAAHNQNSAAIRLDREACTPEWLFYVFMARYEVTRRAGSGGQQPALNRSRVAGLRIPLPPLDEQERIVAEIEEQLSAIDALRSGIERAQRRSASLRRAVLERAFRGELVPQDPSDEAASVLLDRIRTERAANPPRRRRRRVNA